MIKIVLIMICVFLLVGCNEESLKESEVISIDEIMTIYENGSLYVDGRPTGYVCYEQDDDVPKLDIKKENKTYKQTLENYYDAEYEKTRDGIKLEINNSCLEIVEATGKSMLPFFDEENLAIIDTCFPTDKLKVDDVILFQNENSLVRTQHRITKINYKDGWVRTKGDNNAKEDDFKGFEFIYGKTIGTLNVLEDKKIVKEEVIDDETNESFWFSNKSIGGFNDRVFIGRVEYVPPDYSKVGYSRIDVGNTSRLIFLECINSTLKINDTMLYCEAHK